MIETSAASATSGHRLLIADGDVSLTRRLAAAFAQLPVPVDVMIARDRAAAELALLSGEADAILLSLDLEGEGLRLVERVRSLSRGALIVLSTSGSISMAVEAMRRGANDFLVKPVAPELLARRIFARFGEEAARPSMPPENRVPGADFEGFVGNCEVMRAVYAQIERVATSRAPVFVTGESGTGKAVAAEAVHRRSRRAHAPFITINCAAVPPEKLDSEIFGHVGNSRDGHSGDRPGAAELADGGSLFLDELCEMEPALQAKLLHLIQTNEVRRAGDSRTRVVDVRFICATNRDPQAELAAGRLRDDLYYRLNVLPIAMPALRQRTGDVIRLARAFLARLSAEEGRSFEGLAPEAELRLALYPWPGNVRELQNVLRRIVVMNDARFVTADMLPMEIAGSSEMRHPAALPPASRSREQRRPVIEPLWLQEQRIIEQAIEACEGNTARAAAALCISPSTIYRKRQTWASGAAAE